MDERPNPPQIPPASNSPRVPPQGSRSPLTDLESKVFDPQKFNSKKQILEFFQNAFRDQRTLFEAIIDNTPAVIYVKDLSGRYLMVNRAFENLFDVPRKEITGKTDRDLFPKEMADVFRRNDELVIQNAHAVEVEEDALRRGAVRHYISVKFPIRDSDGKVCALAGISTDITAAKQAETAVALSKDYLENLINAVADPIFVKDRQHCWVLLNDAACRFIGHPREMLIGKSDYEFFPKEEADVFWQKDEEVFLGKRENINREDFTDAQGVRHTIVTKKSYYADKHGKEFIVGVIRDISEQTQAAENLSLKSLELAKANAEREYLELFAHVASHDLQEPLQKIIAFGGLLKTHSAQDLDEKGRSFVERLQLAAMRMSRMIEDLLQFTKVTTGSEEFRPVDLEVTIGEVLSDLDLKISQSGAKIETEDLPTVLGDGRQMHLLFLNLLGNALKFQAPNTVPRIQIQAYPAPKNGYVNIEVKDNGIGFDEKYMEKMFHPFERIHSREKYEGSGMGLAICKKIVVRHGGSITARSTEGSGAIFVVTLPAGNI